MRPLLNRHDTNSFRSATVAMSADGQEAEFKPELGRSIFLHWRITALTGLLGLVGAAAFLALAPHAYQATALIYLQPPQGHAAGDGSMQRFPADSNSYDANMQQQIQTVTRQDVLEAAVKQIGGKPATNLRLAVDDLRQKVDVARAGNSFQFGITATADKPDDAARLANAIAASYLQLADREQKGWDAREFALLGEERDRLRTSIVADQTELQSLSQQLGAVNTSAGGTKLDAQIAKTNEALTQARIDHDDAEARLSSMTSRGGGASAALQATADEMAAADPTMLGMKSALSQRRAALTTQMANLTPNHPQYKQASEELAQIDSSLENLGKDLRGKAIDRLQQKLHGELEHTSTVEAQLNRQLGQLTSAAGGASFRMQRANDLTADIARLQTRLATVDGQWNDLKLQESAPAGAMLASSATAPLRHTKSANTRNAVMIFLASLILGLVLAVARHKLDPKVYIATDVEQVIGILPQVILPDFTEFSEKVAEEQLLRLASGIEFAYQQGVLRSCIFTGTGPGVGVTMVATRVRSILEGMGKGTVLVDASGAPVVADTPQAVPGNSLVLAPRTLQRVNHTTVLREMVNEEIRTGEATLVLTDAAPMTLSAEAEYLARFIDSAVVVIESGKTTKKQLRDLSAVLERLNLRAVEFVLNRVSMKMADPDFRNAVADVEQHLASQSRTTARTTERSAPSMTEMPALSGSGSSFASLGLNGPSKRLSPAETDSNADLDDGLAADEAVRFLRSTAKTEMLAGLAPQPAESEAAASTSAADSGTEDLVAELRRKMQQDAATELRASQEAALAQASAAEKPAPQAPVMPPAPEDEGATRMNGMRNIVFSLGLKNLQENRAEGELLRPDPPVESAPRRMRVVKAESTRVLFGGYQRPDPLAAAEDAFEVAEPIAAEPAEALPLRQPEAVSAEAPVAEPETAKTALAPEASVADPVVEAQPSQIASLAGFAARAMEALHAVAPAQEAPVAAPVVEVPAKVEAVSHSEASQASAPEPLSLKAEVVLPITESPIAAHFEPIAAEPQPPAFASEPADADWLNRLRGHIAETISTPTPAPIQEHEVHSEEPGMGVASEIADAPVVAASPEPTAEPEHKSAAESQIEQVAARWFGIADFAREKAAPEPEAAPVSKAMPEPEANDLERTAHAAMDLVARSTGFNLKDFERKPDEAALYLGGAAGFNIHDFVRKPGSQPEATALDSDYDWLNRAMAQVPDDAAKSAPDEKLIVAEISAFKSGREIASNLESETSEPHKADFPLADVAKTAHDLLPTLPVNFTSAFEPERCSQLSAELHAVDAVTAPEQEITPSLSPVHELAEATAPEPEITQEKLHAVLDPFPARAKVEISQFGFDLAAMGYGGRAETESAESFPVFDPSEFWAKPAKLEAPRPPAVRPQPEAKLVPESAPALEQAPTPAPETAVAETPLRQSASPSFEFAQEEESHFDISAFRKKVQSAAAAVNGFSTHEESFSTRHLGVEPSLPLQPPVAAPVEELSADTREALRSLSGAEWAPRAAASVDPIRPRSGFEPSLGAFPGFQQSSERFSPVPTTPPPTPVYEPEPLPLPEPETLPESEAQSRWQDSFTAAPSIAAAAPSALHVEPVEPEPPAPVVEERKPVLREEPKSIPAASAAPEQRRMRRREVPGVLRPKRGQY